MRAIARVLLLAGLTGVGAGAQASPSVKAAAAHFIGGIAWQEGSVLSADFSCAGKKQSAILGTSDTEIVVAVFTQNLGKPPEVLRFDARDRKPAEARLRLEDSALSKDEIQSLSNAAPPGYRQSKTCKGLRLSDDGSDTAHIYWDHEARRFDTWTQ